MGSWDENASGLDTATRRIVIYIKHITSSYIDPTLFLYSLFTPCLGTSCQLLITTVLCFSLFLKARVSSESKIPDHCRAYVLSYLQDDNYVKKCDHEHNARCDRCEILPTLFHEIQDVFGSVDCGEERDEMEYEISEAKQNI